MSENPEFKKQKRRAMSSAAQAVAAKGQLAQEALRVMIQKESRELAAAMTRIKEEITSKLSIMFGPNIRHWSQIDLYNYTWLRDRVGVSELRKHLPEIAESFQKQYADISVWRTDVVKCKKVMDGEPSEEKKEAPDVFSQWLLLNRFLAAVEAAEDSLDQMDQDY